MLTEGGNFSTLPECLPPVPVLATEKVVPPTPIVFHRHFFDVRVHAWNLPGVHGRSLQRSDERRGE